MLLSCVWLLSLCTALFCRCDAFYPDKQEVATVQYSRRSSPGARNISAISNHTSSAFAADLARASVLVDSIKEQAARRNKASLLTPLRSHARPYPAGITPVNITDFEKTKEIAHAIVLVAESDALASVGNATITNDHSYDNQTKDNEVGADEEFFWMHYIERKGSVPFGNDPSYKVCPTSLSDRYIMINPVQGVPKC